MTRTFLRFAICGLFMSALAAACTVKESDDTDDTSCNPGDTQTCTCDDGDKGSRKCNSDGDGYGRCICTSGTGGTEAGAGEGSGASSGTGGYSGGYNGGTGGYGGGYAGSDAGGADTGGAGEAGAGGGGGDVSPAECAEDPNDDCANCYQPACCDEWSACLADDVSGGDDCSTQFFNILFCAQANRDTADATPADLKACAEEEVSGGSAWSDGLRPQVKPMLDCVAGGMGWASNNSFSSDACKVSCFDKL
jgi:hypothetical protein